MTFDFGNALFIGSLAAPLLVGFVGILVNPEDRDRLGLGASLLLLLGSIGLSLLGERQILTPFAFMNAPITLSVSKTGISLHIALVLTLVILFWLALKSDKPTTLYRFFLVQISLSAGFLAFMSGQFMIRYIALDIVGLIAALLVLNAFREPQGLKKFIIVFQILRLGDLFLLVSILLTNTFAGTYDIPKLIAAAVALPPVSRTWVFLGFILAVMIKLAIWPFGIWLRHARESARRADFWTAGFLMPGLGLYLLYRITPIIHADSGFQSVLLIFSVGSFFLAYLKNIRQRSPKDRFLLFSSLLGCFALAAAGVPGTNFFGYFLTALTLVRLTCYLDEELNLAGVRFGSCLLTILANGLFLWVNASVWPTLFMILWGLMTLLWVGRAALVFPAGTREVKRQRYSDELTTTEDASNGLLIRIAGWVNQKFEKNLLSNGIAAVSRGFVGMAAWLRDHIEGGFERIWSGMAQGLTQASEVTLTTLEVKPAEKTDDLIDGALQKLADYESNVLKTTLRWDLALVPLFLLVILVLLFVI